MDKKTALKQLLESELRILEGVDPDRIPQRIAEIERGLSKIKQGEVSLQV